MGFPALPTGWRQVCGKPQHTEEEHSARCLNWICPLGQRYKTWGDVQAYFQLLSFEEDIPGVECRPENARREGDTETEVDVTLEEAADAASKKEEAKAKIQTGSNNRSRTRKSNVNATANDESENSDTENDKKRKKSEDEEYTPDPKDSKTPTTASKRTRRSMPSATVKKNDIPEAQFKCGQCTVVLSSKSDLDIHTKNFHNATVVKNSDVKTEAGKDVINIEASPVTKRDPKGSVNVVTMSEVKTPVAAQSSSKDEAINKTTQKLYAERFEVFKAFCASSDPKVDPVFANVKTIDMFLENLVKKKSVTTSTQAGYKQAILKVQADLKLERRKTLPASVGSSPVTTNTDSTKTNGTVANKAAVIRTSAPSPQQTAAAAAVPRQAAPTPRQAAPTIRQAAPAPRQPAAPAPRQAAPVARQTPPAAPRQPVSAPRQTPPQQQQVRPSGGGQQTTPQRAVAQQQVTVRQTTPQQAIVRQTPPRPSTPQQSSVRQSTPQSSSPQVVGIRPHQGGAASPASQTPIYSPLPSYLAAMVSFSSRLENNSGGGESLYRCAAQHAGLGQEGFKELRRYCHTMLLKWWEWYEPYYAFPLQVKVRVKNSAVQRHIANGSAFKEFIKSEESLLSYNVSECETYCLANVLGVSIYQLTYNLVGVNGRPEQRCKWDTLDPHQGLIHQNKFCRNKEPLYVLHEDKVTYTKIVQAPK